MKFARDLRKTFTLPAVCIAVLWFGSAPTWGMEADIGAARRPLDDLHAPDDRPAAASATGTGRKLLSHPELVERLHRNLAAYYEDIPLCIEQCTETIHAAQQVDDAAILATARMQRSAANLRCLGFEACRPDFEQAICVRINSHQPEIALFYEIARTAVEHTVYSRADSLDRLRSVTDAAAYVAPADVLYAAEFELAARSTIETRLETPSLPSSRILTTMRTASFSTQTPEHLFLSVLQQPVASNEALVSDELERVDSPRPEILRLPELLKASGAARRFQFEARLLAATVLERSDRFESALETLVAARNIMQDAGDSTAVTLTDIRIGTVQSRLGQVAAAKDALISAARHIELITAPSTLTQMSGTGSQIPFFSQRLSSHQANLSAVIQSRFLDIQKQARWMQKTVRGNTALQLQRMLADTALHGAVLETERDSAMRARELYLRLTGIGLLACVGLTLFLLRERRRLRKLNSRLQAEIVERGKATEERERLDLHLAQSVRLESLGDLAGGIAHDFNNLLVGVLGNAELLRYTEQISDRAEEYLNGITVAAETAADLSRKMLAYAGKQPAEKRPVELNQLVERMLPLLRSGAGVRQHVEFLQSPFPVFTEADDGQLEQILLNLVTNASHAMTNCKGTITIRVGTELLEQIISDPSLFGIRREGGDFAWFEVSDCGSGIPESQLTRVFEPFYTTKDHSQSHGFGLAIVYGHVNRHDGLIRLTSTKDLGTTFRIMLPRLSEFHVDNHRVNRASASLAIPKLLTAVVVDDQVQVLQFVQRVFQTNQWTAHCFLSASEALEFLSEAPAVDCLVMDLMMPGVDGASMLEELEQRGLKTPVVLMSGFFEQNTNDLFRFSCVSSLLEKPFRPADLVKAIHTAVILQNPSVATTFQPDGSIESS